VAAGREVRQPGIIHQPPYGWGHRRKMSSAKIEQTRVPFGPELLHEDLAIGVPERDRGHGLLGAAHACAASHELQGMRGRAGCKHPREVQAPRSGAEVRRQGQATVSEPSGVSGKSPSDAHEGRDPMMMTFAPTGTRS
jgi:hypothetical protein